MTFLVIWLLSGLVSLLWFYCHICEVGHPFHGWRRTADYVLAFVLGPIGLLINLYVWLLRRRMGL